MCNKVRILDRYYCVIKHFDAGIRLPGTESGSLTSYMKNLETAANLPVPSF